MNDQKELPKGKTKIKAPSDTITVKVTGNIKAKLKDTENQFYIKVAGLDKATISITFDDSIITAIEFTGRPPQPTIKKAEGEHISHIVGIEEIKGNIKEEYIDKKIYTLNFKYSAESFLKKGKDLKNIHLKECAQQIAQDYLNRAQDKKNVYVSNGTHNLMLAHITQKLRAINIKKAKFPISVEIDEQFHEQADKNFDYFFEGTFVFADVEQFNDVKTLCEKDLPANNADHVDKDRKKTDYWYRAFKHSSSSEESEEPEDEHNTGFTPSYSSGSDSQ